MSLPFRVSTPSVRVCILNPSDRRTMDLRPGTGTRPSTIQIQCAKGTQGGGAVLEIVFGGVRISVCIVAVGWQGVAADGFEAIGAGTGSHHCDEVAGLNASRT